MDYLIAYNHSILMGGEGVDSAASNLVSYLNSLNGNPISILSINGTPVIGKDEDTGNLILEGDNYSTQDNIMWVVQMDPIEKPHSKSLREELEQAINAGCHTDWVYDGTDEVEEERFELEDATMAVIKWLEEKGVIAKGAIK